MSHKTNILGIVHNLVAQYRDRNEDSSYSETWARLLKELDSIEKPSDEIFLSSQVAKLRTELRDAIEAFRGAHANEQANAAELVRLRDHQAEADLIKEQYENLVSKLKAFVLEMETSIGKGIARSTVARRLMGLIDEG